MIICHIHVNMYFTVSSDIKNNLLFQESSPQEGSIQGCHINQTRALCYVLLTHRIDMRFLIKDWSDERLKHTLSTNKPFPASLVCQVLRTHCVPRTNPHRPSPLILFSTGKHPNFGNGRWPWVHKKGKQMLFLISGHSFCCLLLLFSYKIRDQQLMRRKKRKKHSQE